MFSRRITVNPLIDQYAGCLLGLALGDALGAVVEAQPPADARRYVDTVLRPRLLPVRGPGSHRFGQVTDDTQLARELLLSISSTGEFRPAVFAERLLQIVVSGRLVEGGHAPIAAARQLALGVPWFDAGIPAPYAGNGAAMRAGPLGLLFGSDPHHLAQVVSDQARVTHQDPRSAAGALAIAGAVAIAARDEPINRAEFLVELSRWVEPIDAGTATAIWDLTTWAHLPPDEAAGFIADHGLEPEAVHGWHGVSSYVTSSVCWSLYAVLQSPDDWWDAVCTAISIGGDTDTMAAMTGSILGARCGRRALPDEYLRRLTDHGSSLLPELTALATRLLPAT
ncbi:MAG: ADP-ribosylglycohydrolase family protein [Gemmatimonadales bacterium]